MRLTDLLEVLLLDISAGASGLGLRRTEKAERERDSSVTVARDEVNAAIWLYLRPS
jgi:hypothetical protein